MIAAAVSVGTYFCVENPHASMVFDTMYVEYVRSLVASEMIEVDQCQYGLRPPDGRPQDFVRKRTFLWTKLRGAERLRPHCKGPRGQHCHVHAWGSGKDAEGPTFNRAGVAGVYPKSMCTAIGRTVAFSVASGPADVPAG